MTLFVFGEFGGWVEWDTKKIVTIILCLLLLSVLLKTLKKKNLILIHLACTEKNKKLIMKRKIKTG